RSVDGQIAHLRIGQRIPVATGSFQAGVGVGATGGAGFVNPLVNTQFTYLDVGVNVDITPRVHPDHDVSLRLLVEITSHTSDVAIGGITQPVISQRKIEHEIRLKDGEVNILGGLIERTDSKTISGWPGFAKLPILGHLFSDNKVQHVDDEVLIVLTPRIVRMPDWTKLNLRPMLSGTETVVQTKRESELRAPQPEQTQPPPQPPQPQTPQPQSPQQQPPASAASGAGTPAAQGASNVAKIRFEPQSLTLKAGQTATVGVVVENVNDLFSIPLLLQYNPAVISVEEVQHGGFLSGGTQEIAIVSQPFKSSRSRIYFEMLVKVSIRRRNRRRPRSSQAGVTLLELILTCSILLILSTAALPIARFAAVREKEATLRHNLDEIRDAIDRYKDAADHNQIRVELGSEGYPPDLETLVNGVPLGSNIGTIGGSGSSDSGE